MKRILFFLAVFTQLNETVAQQFHSSWSYVAFPQHSRTSFHESVETLDPLTVNIPTAKTHRERYALIIGNEVYDQYRLGLPRVAYAVRDARAFREFARRFWGVPEENIFYLENATAGLMQSYVERLSLILRTAPANAEVYFYFSGHGLQSASDKSFLPAAVDNDPLNSGNGNDFRDMMDKISCSGKLSVFAFTDACFSGRTRDGATTLAARGIRYEPVKGSLPERVVLFAAAKENQFAFSWNEKQHGLFTAVLLEKLRNSPSGTSWNDVVNTVKPEVMEKAARMHFAAQEPVLTGSPAALQHFKQRTISK
ncbi:MAG: hypothetical protein RIQ47_742 [Bacteroidota bacterium]|jgi:hypothetical protein